MESLVRYRAWVVMGVVLIAVVVAVSLAGRGRGPKGAGADRPRVSFGSQVAQPRATGDLVYTNGWVVSSGAQSIGVYAGGQGSDRRNGLIFVKRQTAGSQRIARLIVHGSGAVTLLRPALPATERAAMGETLHFVTGNGATGTLDLNGDSVSVSG